MRKEFDKIKELPDNVIIEQISKQNKAQYVAILYDKYLHLITSLSYKYLNNPIETEDAVMEIYEILYNDILKHPINNFPAWLFSVVKNHCLKRNKSKYDYDNTIDDKIDVNNSDMEEGNKNNYNINKAVNELIPVQKQCIKLFYYEGKSYEDIANETGFTIKKVKSYLQNGKRNLKNILSKMNMN